jgi:hypothetical protein
MKFRFLLMFLLIFAGISCKKNSSTTPVPVVTPDTTKPTISLLDPTLGKTIMQGTALHLQMDLSDNIELKSYKVDIQKSLKGVDTADWAYTNTWTIAAGKKSLRVDHNEILVPTLVTAKQVTTGNYVITVYCTDTAGNEISANTTIVISK